MVGFLLFAFLTITFVVALLPHLVWLVCWLVGKAAHVSVAYSPAGWTTLALLALVWSLMAYGYFVGRYKFEVTEVDYSHPDIPASFEGYKVVHISDLHLSTFADNPSALHRIVDSINAQHPDLICFTGDLVSLGIEEAYPCADELRRLSAKDGVVSVLGNHDFFLYSKKFHGEAERLAEADRLADFQRNELGWTLLRNENLVVHRGEEQITVLGVDNHACKNQGYQTVSLGDLEKAMEGTDGFRFLLSHDPTHWSAEVLPKSDIPLQLSGHTHAAQVRIFGWTPASWTFDETAGIYTKQDASGERSLYVNVGLGCTLPIRIGCDGEITVLTFHRKKSAEK